MKKSVFVTKDVNYGASKSSTTLNTALTPDLLRDGAIGVYGTDSSTNKLVLITDGASGTGLKPAATSGIEDIFVAVGTADGCKISGLVDPTTLKVYSKAYVAPVKQVWSVGYKRSTGDDGQSGTGSLNLPATISKGDEALFKVVDKSNPDGIVRTGDTYSGFAKQDSAATYDILKNLLDSLEADANRKVEMEIVGKGTITEFIQDPTFTNGSTTVTFAGAQTVAAGAYIAINGALYKTPLGVSAGTSLELDRAFKGATVTVDVDMSVNLAGTIATLTAFGFELTDSDFEMNNQFAFLGILSSTDDSVITAKVTGNGTYAKIVEKEKNSWVRTLRRERVFGLPDLQAVSGTTYDQYILQVNNKRAVDIPTGTINAVAQITTAFVSTVADTGGKNQSDFEDILASLGVTVTTLF